MAYSKKDEETLTVVFFLFVIFLIYNFIFGVSGFFKIPTIVTDDFFVLENRAEKPLPREIKDIIIVAVDNDTLKQVGLQWPWKRSVYADLVAKIHSGGPKAIFLDFAFMGKANDESSDMIFAEALKKAGTVILAGYIDERGEYVKPLEMLAAFSAGVGFVNKKNFRARDAQEVFHKDTVFEYGVEVKILAQAQGIPRSAIRYDANNIVLSKKIAIPVNEYGVLPINYAATVSDFTTVSAYKVLDSSIDREVFKDKIVMVGMTADSGQDIHDTLFGKIPGIYINANTLLMFISGNFVNRLPYAFENKELLLSIMGGRFKEALPGLLNVLILLLFTFGIGMFAFRFKALYSAFFVSVVLYGVSLGYGALQIRHNFRMDIFSLFFLSGISFIGVEAYKYISLLMRSEKLKTSAITEQATGIFTQRYFQLSMESVLIKGGIRQKGFFCFMSINEFSKITALSPQSARDIIKALSAILKEYCGKKIILARYGESALVVCLWHNDRKKVEKALRLAVKEIVERDFIVENNALRLSVKIAAVAFPQEHIRSYADVVLTSESMLQRMGSDAQVPVAVFDPKRDTVVRANASCDAAKILPKEELEYISMDLEARNKELEEALRELKKQQKKIEETYFETMHSLVKALEEKDPYTSGHSERVSRYAQTLAKGLLLSEEEIDAIQKAAYLHDIGKIGLPDRVLHKKERLNDEEFEYIKRHQADGARILEGLPFYKEIVPYILYHHERYDGKGYPHGLSGDMIPRGAQIISIADAYDAMTTGRGYNNPLTAQEAIAELKKSLGQQFHPLYAETFIKLLEEKKIHAFDKA